LRLGAGGPDNRRLDLCEALNEGVVFQSRNADDLAFVEPGQCAIDQVLEAS
jgi:hypothetical protein